MQIEARISKQSMSCCSDVIRHSQVGKHTCPGPRIVAGHFWTRTEQSIIKDQMEIAVCVKQKRFGASVFDSSLQCPDALDAVPAFSPKVQEIRCHLGSEIGSGFGNFPIRNNPGYSFEIGARTLFFWRGKVRGRKRVKEPSDF